ncbi:helix-turn-helix domain-containing protein [Kitasatospora sp. NPDC058965]|uniref:helix-turn-helix domain-containing protein n=1 Tax=Kitasatospora sp. NPDC058965 TaxID=3346682 RepID=UPI00367ACFFA
METLRGSGGKPSLRQIEAAAAAGGGERLPASTISDLLSGRRLPTQEVLIRLVQVLHGFADAQKAGRREVIPAGRNEDRVQRWKDEWIRLDRLHAADRRASRTESATAPRSSRVRLSLPPGGAGLPELDAARDELHDFRKEITERRRKASIELSAAFERHLAVEADIVRLRREKAQDLQEKITALEDLRAELGRRITHLRQELQELQEDQLEIAEEENELFTRQVELQFAWARSEERDRLALAAAVANERVRHRAELDLVKQRLAAADELITRLRATGAP